MELYAAQVRGKRVYARPERLPEDVRKIVEANTKGALTLAEEVRTTLSAYFDSIPWDAFEKTARERNGEGAAKLLTKAQAHETPEMRSARRAAEDAISSLWQRVCDGAFFSAEERGGEGDNAADEELERDREFVDTFVLVEGWRALARFAERLTPLLFKFYSPARTPHPERCPTHLVASLNDVLAILRDLCYRNPELGARFATNDVFLETAFQLLFVNETFEAAELLCEELLCQRKKLFAVEAIPLGGISHLIARSSPGKLAALCRLLSLFTLDWEERAANAGSRAKSFELLRLRRATSRGGALDPTDPITRNHLALMTEGRELLPRLIKLLAGKGAEGTKVLVPIWMPIPDIDKWFEEGGRVAVPPPPVRVVRSLDAAVNSLDSNVMLESGNPLFHPRRRDDDDNDNRFSSPGAAASAASLELRPFVETGRGEADSWDEQNETQSLVTHFAGMLIGTSESFRARLSSAWSRIRAAMAARDDFEEEDEDFHQPWDPTPYSTSRRNDEEDEDDDFAGSASRDYLPSPRAQLRRLAPELPRRLSDIGLTGNTMAPPPSHRASPPNGEGEGDEEDVASSHLEEGEEEEYRLGDNRLESEDEPVEEEEEESVDDRNNDINEEEDDAEEGLTEEEEAVMRRFVEPRYWHDRSAREVWMISQRLEVMFLVCTMCAGPLKSRVQDALAQAGLVEALTDRFDDIVWNPYNPGTHLTRTHGEHCECNPLLALKTQLLRLIHNFCDRESSNAANKALLFTPLDMAEVGSLVDRRIPLPVFTSGGNTETPGVPNAEGHGLAWRVATAMVGVCSHRSTDHALKFWLCAALEAILRGSPASTKQLVCEWGVLEAVTSALLRECDETDARRARAAANGGEEEPEDEAAKDARSSVLQTNFDLLGEIVKDNPRALAWVCGGRVAEGGLEEAMFESLCRLAGENLVDGNVFFRSVAITVEKHPHEESLECARRWLVSEQATLVVRGLLTVVSMEDTSQENLCCLNTAIILLLFARRRGEMEALLTNALRLDLHAVASSAFIKQLKLVGSCDDLDDPGVVNAALNAMGRTRSGLGGGSASCPPPRRGDTYSSEATSCVSHGATRRRTPPPSAPARALLPEYLPRTNFRKLLFFWRAYYCCRRVDRDSLEFSSGVPFIEMQAAVDELCGGEALVPKGFVVHVPYDGKINSVVYDDLDRVVSVADDESKWGDF